MVRESVFCGQSIMLHIFASKKRKLLDLWRFYTIFFFGQIKLAASRPEALLAAGIPASVVTQIEQGHSIAAIKAYRAEKNVSLREAKVTIELLMGR